LTALTPGTVNPRTPVTVVELLANDIVVRMPTAGPAATKAKMVPLGTVPRRAGKAATVRVPHPRRHSPRHQFSRFSRRSNEQEHL
jgi:hypothetical protein